MLLQRTSFAKNEASLKEEAAAFKNHFSVSNDKSRSVSVSFNSIIISISIIA